MSPSHDHPAITTASRAMRLDQSRASARPTSLVWSHRPFFGVKPEAVLIGGHTWRRRWADPNASIPTPQPACTTGRCVGAFGKRPCDEPGAVRVAGGDAKGVANKGAEAAGPAVKGTQRKDRQEDMVTTRSAPRSRSTRDLRVRADASSGLRGRRRRCEWRRELPVLMFT